MPRYVPREPSIVVDGITYDVVLKSLKENPQLKEVPRLVLSAILDLADIAASLIIADEQRRQDALDSLNYAALLSFSTMIDLIDRQLLFSCYKTAVASILGLQNARFQVVSDSDLELPLVEMFHDGKNLEIKRIAAKMIIKMVPNCIEHMEASIISALSSPDASPGELYPIYLVETCHILSQTGRNLHRIYQLAPELETQVRETFAKIETLVIQTIKVDTIGTNWQNLTTTTMDSVRIITTPDAEINRIVEETIACLYDEQKRNDLEAIFTYIAPFALVEKSANILLGVSIAVIYAFLNIGAPQLRPFYQIVIGWLEERGDLEDTIINNTVYTIQPRELLKFKEYMGAGES